MEQKRTLFQILAVLAFIGSIPGDFSEKNPLKNIPVKALNRSATSPIGILSGTRVRGILWRRTDGDEMLCMRRHPA